jgi:hypothetical protein
MEPEHRLDEPELTDDRSLSTGRDLGPGPVDDGPVEETTGQIVEQTIAFRHGSPGRLLL